MSIFTIDPVSKLVTNNDSQLKVPAKGPMVWVVSLTILQGICGMAFGLVISALCDNEQDAIQLALGSFYPNLLLSGIIWPLGSYVQNWVGS